MLNSDQRRLLLSAARSAVAARLHLHAAGDPAHTTDRVLLEPRAAFVSVHLQEELRGCIGTIDPAGPLLRTVIHCAVSAAFEDERFSPLTAGELPHVVFEISVLSAMQTIAGPEEIVVGRDGLIVTAGRVRGLLLPQVAARLGWGADQFLEATCRKAGLPPAAWREAGVKTEVFTAEVFSEAP